MTFVGFRVVIRYYRVPVTPESFVPVRVIGAIGAPVTPAAEPDAALWVLHILLIRFHYTFALPDCRAKLRLDFPDVAFGCASPKAAERSGRADCRDSSAFIPCHLRNGCEYGGGETVRLTGRNIIRN